jgi:hypothetical protein
MNIEFIITEHINAPSEITFEILSDIHNYEKWKPGMLAIQLISGSSDAMDESTMWRETRILNGLVKSDVYEVISITPPILLVLKVNGWKGSARIGEFYYDYHFIQDSLSTSIVLKNTIKLHGIYAIFARLVLFHRKSKMRKDLRQLKYFAERKFNRAQQFRVINHIHHDKKLP